MISFLEMTLNSHILVFQILLPNALVLTPGQLIVILIRFSQGCPLSEGDCVFHHEVQGAKLAIVGSSEPKSEAKII